MELGENLVNEELLQEADIAFSSNFKREVSFEMPVLLSRIPDETDENNIFFDIKSPRRSLSSIEAELLLCKQLGWDAVLKVDFTLYKFHEIQEIVKTAGTIFQKKVDVSINSLTRNELDTLRPYVATVIADIKTVNRTVQKRIVPSKQLLDYLTMLGEAQGLERGIEVRLGIGESLEDIAELTRFIETHKITKVTFLPALKQLAGERRSPSSFYIARWIAETRINFPKIKIVVGTWLQREAEVGLFLHAGANAITQFPALKFFNSEASKIIEQESRNAKRVLLGTLTDSSPLNDMDKFSIKDEVKGTLERYISSIKKK